MTPIFPAGAAGAGLLILRLSLAVSLYAVVRPWAGFGDWRQVATIVAAVALGVGVGTRLIAVLTLIAPLAAAVAGGVSILLLLHSAIALAVALIGAGAFSADARLFGRRRITLPARRPPSG